MLIRGLTSFIAISAISVMPVLAQVVDPVTASEAAQSSDESKLVCKGEAKTGTRFKTRTCHTKAEWEEIRQQHQRDLREVVDAPHICGGGPSAEGC